MDILFKLASYFYPITIFKGKSEFNPCLEVTWYNGKLMLNSNNANYSFGNLHLIFQKAFKDTALKINPHGRLLLLGLGGGSVPHILRREYHFRGETTAVEIDQMVVDLYWQYFADRRNSSTHIICRDAKLAIADLPDARFDLIVCDLFIDLEVPDFVLEESFVQSMSRVLQIDGTVYMNIMLPENQNPAAANDLMQIFFKYYKEVVRLNYHERNLFIVAKKPK